MSTIQAILFDMDGVIVDTEPQYDTFLGELQPKYNLPKDFNTQVKGLTLPNILSTFFSNSSEEVKKDFEQKVNDFELNDMKYDPIPGALEFIKSVKEKGYRLALVTSSSRIKVQKVLPILDLENTFEYCITSDDVNQGKPNPECYALGAEKLNIPPTQCLVFEDSFAGIEAAKNAGIKVVGISTTNSEDSLKDKVSLVIPNFLDLNIDNIIEEI